MPLFGPPDMSALMDKRNVNGLIKALRYKNDPEIRVTAAHALGSIVDFSIGDYRIVPPLIDALKDQEWSVRRAAAVVLGGICAIDPDYLPPSINVGLWVPGPIARAAHGGFGQLGRLEDTDVETLMTKAAREGDVESLVALVAVRAFNHIIAALIAALTDRQKEVRGAVACVLGQIGDARAVEPLKAARDDSSQWVRDNAGRALKQISEKS